MQLMEQQVSCRPTPVSGWTGVPFFARYSRFPHPFLAMKTEIL